MLNAELAQSGCLITVPLESDVGEILTLLLLKPWYVFLFAVRLLHLFALDEHCPGELKEKPGVMSCKAEHTEVMVA